VHLEASTKPHVHQKFEIFWTNIASTMACPNFKNRPKKGLGPIGVNFELIYFQELIFPRNICFHKVPASFFVKNVFELETSMSYMSKISLLCFGHGSAPLFRIKPICLFF
jgi:hypothetical protein